jgi:hypothetical protein
MHADADDRRGSRRSVMLVMEVIVRLQDRALCASITCITGTYAEPEGPVIFDHRHNADVRANWWQIAELWRRRRATGTTEPARPTLIAQLHLLARSWDVDGTLPYSQPDTWSGPHA